MRWETDEEVNRGNAGTINCPVRVYCSNVGDSRCVMLKTYETKDILVAPTFGLQPKSPSASNEAASNEATLIPPLKHAISLDRNELSSKHKSRFGQVPSSSARSSKFVAVHLMSEDHKLSLHRERLRVISATDGKTPADNDRDCWHALPADGSAIYLPQYAKTPPPITFRGLPPIPVQRTSNKRPRVEILYYFDDSTSPFNTSPSICPSISLLFPFLFSLLFALLFPFHCFPCLHH
jgi:hypothetical protein